MILEQLQARIKNSRLHIGEKNGVQRLYIRYGQNGRGVKTSAWLEVVNDRITPMVKVENIYHANLYDNKLAERYKEEISRQFHEIINNCELERKKVPLHERLRDDVIPVYDANSLRHQASALRFCCSMKVTALYADTGTGKSKIAIDLAVSRFEARQIKKVLVFLPVSTKKNFQKQIALWSKSEDITWMLIGHETIGSSNRAVFEVLKFVDSETQIIIDESHAIKNPIAKRSKRIRMICEKTSYKLIMTGTPVTSGVHDLYMQYAVLSSLIIGVRDWKKFEEKYLIMGGMFGDEIIGYKNIDHLAGLLEPYTYQIAKEEAIELPAKQFRRHGCDLTSEQWEYYLIEKEWLLEKIKSDDFQATDIFQSFLRMQQICCGFYQGEFIGTEKLWLVDQLVKDEPIVFFCKYIFEIHLLVEHLGVENCAVFTGENPKERDSELEQFVSGHKKYFVATMQSGGTGLNGLQTVCRHVVFFSNSFNYIHRKQSIGRIDRQGQERDMFVHDFCTSAKIDDKIMNNLRRKGNLADEIKQMMLDRTKLKEYIEEL